MLATCVKTEYQAGGYDCAQSFSRQAPDMLYAEESLGAKVRDRGTGWKDITWPSRLILHVIVEGEEFQVWVDRFFKARLGRLIARRRNVIASTMPQTINVVEKMGRSGKRYFVADEADLVGWLEAILKLPGPR